MLKTVTNSINASQIQTPITLPGDVTLSTGNLVIGTSGKGIDFSATPGTGTSELLADYEEGTFTPVIKGFTTPGTGTYTTQTGLYTKIGNVVYFAINLTQTNHTGTGVMLVDGLPFAIVGTTKVFTAAVRTANLSLTALNVIQTYLAGTFSGTTAFDLEQIPVGGGAVANIPMDTDFSIAITGFYTV
jgi:hypothetical protein